MVTTYPQLDQASLALLSARVDALGSKAAVAVELGVSRTAVSQALASKYPADVRKLQVKINQKYATGIQCPYLAHQLSAEECHDFRNRELSTGSRDSIKHWQACRCCPHFQED